MKLFAKKHKDAESKSSFGILLAMSSLPCSSIEAHGGASISSNTWKAEKKQKEEKTTKSN